MRKQTQGEHKSAVLVCAWCLRYLGIVRGAEGVSHGICLDCKTRELARWGATNSLAGGHGNHQGGPLFAEVKMGEGPGIRNHLTRFER